MLMKLSSARKLEEEISMAEHNTKAIVETYKKLGFNKQIIKQKEKALRSIREAKKDIQKEIDKLVAREIRTKSNKQKKEWHKKHPKKKGIDYFEEVVEPRLKRTIKKYKL